MKSLPINKADPQREKEQILKAQANPAEFEPLYHIHYPRVLGFIYNRVSDLETAYDLASQTFVQVLQALPKYVVTGAPFSFWIIRIAKSVLAKYYQTSGKQISVAITDEALQKMEDDPEFSTEIRFEAISLVLQTLGINDLELIQLRFFESYSFKEIALILKISENNAKVKTFRVIEKIKKLLKKSDHETL